MPTSFFAILIFQFPVKAFKMRERASGRRKDGYERGRKGWNDGIEESSGISLHSHQDEEDLCSIKRALSCAILLEIESFFILMRDDDTRSQT